MPNKKNDFFIEDTAIFESPPEKDPNKEYLELTNVSRQMATIDLSEMVKKSALERKRQGNCLSIA